MRAPNSPPLILPPQTKGTLFLPPPLLMPQVLETAVVSDLDASLADRELTELKAKDYEEIAEVLAPFEESGFLGGSDGGTAQNINPPTAGAGNENGADSSSEIKPNPNTAGGDTDEKLARNKTNTQVDGVSEADIVKTDGDYIYYSTTDTIDIVLMGEDGDMEHVAKIKDQEFCYTLDLFLHESKLVVLASSNTGLDSQRKMAEISSGESRSSVKITIYDVSDPSSPQVDRVLTQEGDYKDARMIGSQLYVVSQDFMYLQETNQAEPSSFIPSISDSSNTSLQMLSADSIYLLPQIRHPVIILSPQWMSRTPAVFSIRKLFWAVPARCMFLLTACI